MSDPSQSRADGRCRNALRPFSVNWDPMGFALSSVTVRTGRTTVLCSICVDESVPRWRRGEGLGWLSAEYRLLPGSTPQRQGRELMKLSGRTQEIQRLIGRSLRAAVDMAQLGERTLLIDCDVIQAVGLVEGHALLDLDYSEDSRAEVDLNVVQADDGRLLEVQGTAEGAPFSRAQLDTLLDLAEPGLQQLMEAQRQALKSE